MTNGESILEASVLVLCGIPGSGKSTLASSILRHYNGSKSKDDNDDGDDDNEHSSQLISGRSDDNCLTFHRVFLHEYDAITTSLLSLSAQQSHQLFSLEDLEAWRKTRTEALTLLTNNLSSCLEDARKRQRQQQGEHEENNPNPNPKRILIIMDDNFHLRSMRRDVYKTCQNFITSLDVREPPNPNNYHDENDENDASSYSSSLIHEINIGLSIIHVNTPLEECLANNDKRKGTPQYIPEDIITNMNETLEEPNAEKQQAKFESCSLDTCRFVLFNQNNDNCTYDHENNNDDDQDDDNNINHPNGVFYKCLEECISTSMTFEYQIKPPLPPLVTKTPQQLEKERAATLQSRLHRIDLLLRDLVGVTCRANKKLARLANTARKTILAECKSGHGSTRSDTAIINNVGRRHDHNNDWVVDQFETQIFQNAEQLYESEKNNIQSLLFPYRITSNRDNELTKAN